MAPGALTEPIRSIGSQFAERACARGEAGASGRLRRHGRK